MKPDKPFYLFSGQDISLREKYNENYNLDEIFKIKSIGIVTANDNLVLDTNKKSLENKISKLTSYDEKKVKEVYYKPFDKRLIYYDKKLIGRDRSAVAQHLFEPNISLIYTRSFTSARPFEHIMCGDHNVLGRFFPDASCITYFAPLHLYIKNEKEVEIIENLSTKFRLFINDVYLFEYKEEKIFSYIYAILHSPTYRTKYIEFLKMDFPRIPFTSDKKIFEELSDIGNKLIEAHLLKNDDLKDRAKIDLKGNGDEIVDKLLWTSGKLFINKTQWFEPVTKEVYEFYIGGYQVLDKFLKDRKGRSISGEIYHICFIIQSLQFTLQQMEIINKKTASWI